jgi:glycosyltransferase involved in cell wall biosynthesis
VIGRPAVGRVSVVIPVHNNREQLREAVLSVLAQRVPDLEVVVVDDGSTDGGAEALADLPVKVVRQANQGHPAARNTGLAHATGAVVGFLDSDDLCATDGLPRLAAWLAEHPDREVVGGLPAGVIDGAGAVLKRFPIEASPDPVVRRLDLDLYRSGRFFPVNVWLYLFRRSFFDRVGTFDASIRFSDDADLILRALVEGPIPILDVPMAWRRVHANNLSLASDDGGPALKPECIDELKRIYERHGVRPRVWNWKPFETGFDLPPVERES